MLRKVTVRLQNVKEIVDGHLYIKIICHIMHIEYLPHYIQAKDYCVITPVAEPHTRVW
jgi:hypothetical protein